MFHRDLTVFPGSNKNLIKYKLAQIKFNIQLYLLLIPVLAYFIIFRYLPMYGLRMAFIDFNPVLGFSKSPWVGFEQFIKLFNGPYFLSSLKNTISLSLYSLMAGMPFPIIFALLLNTISHDLYKKTVQTITYAPHFISTVVIVGMLRLFLSPSSGIINQLSVFFGGKSINFFAKSSLFPSIYVWSGIWQNTGWNAVIYIAALSSVSPELHEAAIVDGADRLKRVWYIDLPSIIPTIIVLLIMNIGSLVSVGFEKVYLMQTDLNLATSETTATYSYKVGLEQAQYSYSAAIGFLNSFINFTLMIIVNQISKYVTETSLW
jgi:putative aldouronate transport system permease protein